MLKVKQSLVVKGMTFENMGVFRFANQTGSGMF